MINYVTGDATEPTGEGVKIIAHICNDIGRWGSGFVVPLGNKYPLAKEIYKKHELQLEDIQLIPVVMGKYFPDIWICNMVAQHKVKGQTTDGLPPIRYEALQVCLASLDNAAYNLREAFSEPMGMYTLVSIHMPRIGCGLAGGEWGEVEKIIEDNVQNSEVYVYDLP